MRHETAIGLTAFSNNKAEHEPWLVEYAFVDPPDFEFLKTDHSTIVYGSSGFGKSAIRLALEHYTQLSPRRLIVPWSPSLSNSFLEVNTDSAMAQLKDILHACSQTLVEKLIQEPAILRKAGPTAQEYLVWFIKRFVFSAPDAGTFSNLSKKETDLIRELKTRSVREFFTEDPDPIIIATEFTKALEKIGFASVWIMTDGLDWRSTDQRRLIVDSLKAIFSTLKLFEIPSFYYKMTLPMQFEVELAEASAITRHRAMAFRLSWDINYLTAIIQRRISLALGDDDTTFDDIYGSKEICAWLEGCGGLSPRGWLEYMRPIIATYRDILSKDKQRKLTKTEWSNARSRSSLHLRFDAKTNQVTIGLGEPKTLSPEMAAIFSYLVNNQGKYCTKRELYYRAYVPLITPEEKLRDASEQLALSKEYDDLINTAIYRLRQLIEPIPSDPVFLTTKRDIGIKLSVQAFH
jgi:hypothetical protein